MVELLKTVFCIITLSLLFFGPIAIILLYGYRLRNGRTVILYGTAGRITRNGVDLTPSKSERLDAKQPWRTIATEAWLTIGQHVRDEFGNWWIQSLPEDDATYGYAQVGIASALSKDVERYIWLSEFLRDFQPGQVGQNE